MAGSEAAKKLWRSLRTCVLARREVKKWKLALRNALKKKKVFRSGEMQYIQSSSKNNDRYDIHHYNYSDDDDVENRFKSKLQNWIKAMSCSFGRVHNQPAYTGQFVYVTDIIYRNQILNSFEKTIASASGGSPTDGNKKEESAIEFDMKAFLSAAVRGEAYQSTDTSTSQAELNCEDKKKIFGSTDAEKVDTDTDVELFIAKFYDAMKLQRQRSIDEYLEMLDRGAS